jgi:hypothetical protein
MRIRDYLRKGSGPDGGVPARDRATTSRTEDDAGRVDWTLSLTVSGRVGRRSVAAAAVVAGVVLPFAGTVMTTSTDAPASRVSPWPAHAPSYGAGNGDGARCRRDPWSSAAPGR